MINLNRSRFYCALLLGLCAGACSSTPPTTSSTPPENSPTPFVASTPPPLVAGEEIAVIETDFGKIKLRLFSDVAPKHVENFKKLVREGFYNGLAFHRLIPNGIIQGGDPTTRENDRSKWGMGLPDQPTVPAEFNSRPYLRGAVGAARKGDPNSASSQFFICLAPHPEWNGKYTVFGQVIDGINTVQVISNAPLEVGSERPREKVVMRRVYLEKYNG